MRDNNNWPKRHKMGPSEWSAWMSVNSSWINAAPNAAGQYFCSSRCQNPLDYPKEILLNYVEIHKHSFVLSLNTSKGFFRFRVHTYKLSTHALGLVPSWFLLLCNPCYGSTKSTSHPLFITNDNSNKSVDLSGRKFWNSGKAVCVCVCVCERAAGVFSP